MPRRLAASLLACVTILAGCGSSSAKWSAGDIERFLEGKGSAHVICTDGSDGWDYTCRSSGRKIGVEVGDGDRPIEMSEWTPIEQPLQVGPGGEGTAVRARFVDEASSVCREMATMVGRLPPPVSRIDALSRIDQVLDLRRQELIKLEAIKPPVALLPDYTQMVGALTQVLNEEMMLRDAIATSQKSALRAVLASRADGARMANESARRVGLPACSNAAMPLPVIALRR